MGKNPLREKPDRKKSKESFEKSVPMAITNYRRHRRDGSTIPILSDTDVEIAKEFVDENKK